MVCGTEMQNWQRIERTLLLVNQIGCDNNKRSEMTAG